jgi:hypothetical protein
MFSVNMLKVLRRPSLPLPFYELIILQFSLLVAGPVRRDVLGEHAEGAAAAQPDDLHLPPLPPPLLCADYITVFIACGRTC